MYFKLKIYGQPLFNGTGYTENRLISIETVRCIENFLSNFTEIEFLSNNSSIIPPSFYSIPDIDILKINRKVKLYNLSGEKNLTQFMYLNLTNLLFGDKFESFENLIYSYSSNGTSGTSGSSGTSTLLDRYEKVLRLKYAKKYNLVKPKEITWYLNKYKRKEKFVKV